MVERLKGVYVEHHHAHRLIEIKDDPNTFFYADPPYIDCDQGHYGGYTREHYRRDLDALTGIEGKFLLSSFPSDILNEYVKENQWHSIELNLHNSASSKKGKGNKGTKTEVLTANYPISHSMIK